MGPILQAFSCPLSCPLSGLSDHLFVQTTVRKEAEELSYSFPPSSKQGLEIVTGKMLLCLLLVWRNPQKFVSSHVLLDLAWMGKDFFL